ncbi:hypothetical protein HOP50_01g00060 [Chloropicon primus]|nr:hypothetical protein HOP50_01g00060 [Chloropicon primus]
MEGEEGLGQEERKPTEEKVEEGHDHHQEEEEGGGGMGGGGQEGLEERIGDLEIEPTLEEGPPSEEVVREEDGPENLLSGEVAGNEGEGLADVVGTEDAVGEASVVNGEDPEPERASSALEAEPGAPQAAAGGEDNADQVAHLEEAEAKESRQAATADDYAYSSQRNKAAEAVGSKAKQERERAAAASVSSADPEDGRGGRRQSYGSRASANPTRVKVLNQDERQLSRAADAYGKNLMDAYGKKGRAPEQRAGGGVMDRGGAYGSAPAQEPPAPHRQPKSSMDNLVAELGSKLARQTAKLEAAEKGKEELEDMLLRIEKHFKTEQMLRRKAEVSLDQMRQSLKNSEMDGSRLKSERQALERQKLKNIQERTKLEEERSQMQVMIQTAGEQERKAKIELQELHHSVTTREEMIQYRLQASYSATIAKLEAEISRLKEELEYRTVSMHQELQKWRDQAQFATNALREAKNEVIDRKRELDTTKERMDLLVEKLYTGRERGMELRGAIDVQIHQSQLAHEMREKFQAQQHMQPQMPVDVPYGGPGPSAAAGASYPPNEVSLRLPAVDPMPPRIPQQAKQPERNPASVNHDFGRPIKPEIKVDQGTTPRPIAGQRGKRVAGEAGPSYSRKAPQSKVESRRGPPRQKGYAQIHIRESKESVKRSRPSGGHRGTPPPSQPSRGGKDRWTESNRESAMAAYAARWE